MKIAELNTLISLVQKEIDRIENIGVDYDDEETLDLLDSLEEINRKLRNSAEQLWSNIIEKANRTSKWGDFS